MKIAAFFENIADGALNTGVPIQNALSDLYALGMHSIYISYTALSSRKELLLPMFQKIGLEIEGIHEHVDFGTNPDDERCLEMIRLAKEAGAHNVLFVPGMIRTDDPSERELLLSNMTTALSKAVAYGKEKGIAVSMEDFDGFDAPYNCIEGLKWFMDQVPGLQCSFDTGNFNTYKEDELEAFQIFRKNICTMHIKDRSLTPINAKDKGKLCMDGSYVYPAPVGSGYIKIKEIIELLKEDNYQGALIAELYDYSSEEMLSGVQESVRWLNSILEGGN